MTKNQNLYFFWALAFILAGVLIRLIHIDLPVLEGAITRQLQTAVISRNLLENGFDFLHPQIDYLPEPRYYTLESPVYNSIVALLYLVFGVHEYLGRLVSVLFFAGTALFIFRIASRNINDSTARAAVFVFCFSPLSIIFTRAFQPDPMALFFSVGCVFYFVEWIKGNNKAYVMACGFGLIAFLTKQTYMFILLPLFLYGLATQKELLFKNAKAYFFVFISILPAILWTFHAKSLNNLFPSLYIAGNFEISNWFQLSTFLKYSFYKTIFQWLSGLILTPLGFTLFLVGVFVKSNSKGDTLINSWLLGVAVFYILLHKHAYTHEYYHLPLLPVASIIIGKAWWFFFENDKQASVSLFASMPFKILGFFMVAVMVYGYSNSGFELPRAVKNFYQETQALNQNTKDGDLIVATEGHHLYYGNNKGWGFPPKASNFERVFKFWAKGQDLEPNLINLLNIFRDEGANYFFVTNLEFFYSDKQFADYVFDHYPLVDKQEGISLLFDLKAKPEGPL